MAGAVLGVMKLGRGESGAGASAGLGTSGLGKGQYPLAELKKKKQHTVHCKCLNWITITHTSGHPVAVAWERQLDCHCTTSEMFPSPYFSTL